MDISKLSVKELSKLQDKIDGTIKDRQKQERAELKRRIRNMAKENGTTVEELFGLKQSGQRAKAAPKYRNPDDASQTWSGRGRPPRWMQAKLDAGNKKEKFLIK